MARSLHVWWIETHFKMLRILLPLLLFQVSGLFASTSATWTTEEPIHHQYARLGASTVVLSCPVPEGRSQILLRSYRSTADPLATRRSIAPGLWKLTPVCPHLSLPATGEEQRCCRSRCAQVLFKKSSKSLRTGLKMELFRKTLEA
ncbi:uncharacterized protein LOC120320011 isoform X2 [Crotalus tigris]|uniref:uncharacterized protein LOC120320011 isoform X2 n=1 Tax=Crotalus tigris TaxID=88082 RepID=UPI00192F84D3|nr:uncharacterized protein LOC120320011 isoform X2 [Crotalus tigris]